MASKAPLCEVNMVLLVLLPLFPHNQERIEAIKWELLSNACVSEKPMYVLKSFSPRIQNKTSRREIDIASDFFTITVGAYLYRNLGAQW